MSNLVALVLSLLWLVCAASQIEQVKLFLTGNPSSMKISWITQHKKAATVHYGIDPDNLFLSATGSSNQYNLKDYTSGHIKIVELKNLQPDTQYYFACEGPNGVFSNVLEFKTAPASWKPFNIALTGDLGQTKNSLATGQAIVNDPTGIDMILHPGDLSYANSDESRWDTYGNMFNFLSSKVPWMVCPGNHENYGTKSKPFKGFQNRFFMPFKESGATEGNHYWSMDYSYAHIVSMSTEIDYSKKSLQYKWFLNDMKNIDREKTPWLIVMYHRPFYNSNFDHQGEADAFRDIYEDLFFENCVDIAISGHVHSYERSLPVYKNKVGGPTQYFVVGNGGNYEGLSDHWYPQPDWSAFRTSRYGYSRMKVLNETTIKYDWFSNDSMQPCDLDLKSSMACHETSDSIIIVRPYPRLCSSVKK